MKRAIVISGLLAFLLATLQCSPGERASEEPSPEAVALNPAPEPGQSPELGIEWGLPEQRVIGGQLECSGVVEVPPYSMGSVYAPIRGWVREVRHHPGQSVRKGERLTVLEHPDIIRRQHDLLASASRLAALESNYRRKQRLAGTEATSQRALEQAKAAYEEERSLFGSLRAELGILGFAVESLLETGQIEPRLVLRAPMSGYLQEVNVNLGKLVQPEELLFALVDTRHVHLELQVFAKDLLSLREGMRVEAFQPGSDSLFAAKVLLIGQMVDPGKKTAAVHAHFEQEPVPLTPGTYMRARVQLGDEEVVALPNEALLRAGDQTFVLVKQGDRISRRPVRPGRTDQGYTEVLDLELADEEQVALRGAYYLNASLESGD